MEEYKKPPEAEAVGVFPIRQDIIVHGSDGSACLNLGWIRERIGSEVFPLSKYHEIPNIRQDMAESDDPNKLPKFVSKHAIFDRDSLKVGDDLAVPCIWGYAKATVIEVNADKGCAKSECNRYLLEYEANDRGCWVCVGSISESAIKMININFEGESGGKEADSNIQEG